MDTTSTAQILVELTWEQALAAEEAIGSVLGSANVNCDESDENCFYTERERQVLQEAFDIITSTLREARA